MRANKPRTMRADAKPLLQTPVRRFATLVVTPRSVSSAFLLHLPLRLCHYSQSPCQLRDSNSLMASVAGAAVLGPDASPWFLQAFTSNEDEPLRFQRAVHCALDAVPPVQALSSTAQPSSSTPPPTGYLGVIFASAEDACAVYGYVTATSVTLMLALEGDDDVRDADMRAAFDRFHAAYSDAVANPFHTLGQPISSTKFVQRVKSVCRGVR